MSFDRRLGFGSAILTLLGIAVTFLWPSQRWIGWVCLAGAACLALGWLWDELRQYVIAAYQTYPVWPLIGACLIFSLVVSLALRFNPRGSPVSQIASGIPTTATPALETYISEGYRFRATELNFQTIEELKAAKIKLVNGKRPFHYSIPMNQATTVINVIIRNVGNSPVKDARVFILSNTKIEGKTAGMSIVDPYQVVAETPMMEPFSNIGNEYFYSLAVATPEGRTLAIIEVRIEANNLKRYAALATVLFEKTAESPAGIGNH